MDSQQHRGSDFRSYVAQALHESEPKSVTAYAAGSLVALLDRYGLSELDADTLRLWIASMLLGGLKAATVRRYAGRLHTLYKEWGGADLPDPFEEVQPAYDPSYQPDEADVLVNLEALKRLFSKSELSADWQMVNIFFYLLYSPDASLLDAADATFDNSPRYCAQIDEIVKQCDSSNGRKYLFSLNQSKVRPTQLSRELNDGLTSLMRSVGMRIAGGQAREEITAIWIAAAMKCGVDICLIRSIIASIPYRYRALKLIRRQEISEGLLHETVCRVADSINDNTPRWFAMKLRKGVGFSDVKEKISTELPGRLNAMELYYPTRTIVKKVGKKKVKEEMPLVPDMLFFRTQYNKVRSLFASIGDVAWCFKTSQAGDSRYSVIPHAEMANFQRSVGQFTSDIRVELSDTAASLGKGRMVRITGGMMKGYQGRIVDLNDDNGSRKFFLTVSNENALNWTVAVDEVFIEPLDI